MKRIIVSIVSLILVASVFAQNDSTLSPSTRFKVFPPTNFLMSDSVTYLSKATLPKNKQVLFMVFNPECDHCQHETENILKNIEAFKKIQIVMITMVSISEMKSFIEKYKLNQFNNISVAKDINYFLPTFFQIRNLPFLAFYDKKLKLISEFSGSLPIEKILKEFDK